MVLIVFSLYRLNDCYSEMVEDDSWKASAN
jgi:hypothetical protein